MCYSNIKGRTICCTDHSRDYRPAEEYLTKHDYRHQYDSSSYRTPGATRSDREHGGAGTEGRRVGHWRRVTGYKELAVRITRFQPTGTHPSSIQDFIKEFKLEGDRFSGYIFINSTVGDIYSNITATGSVIGHDN